MVRPKPHLKDLDRTPPVLSTRMESVRMDKNEFIPCWPSAWFEDFLRRVKPEHISVHPELGPLYDKIAKTLHVPKESLVVTAGSDLAIKGVFEVFAEPGDELIMLDPTFAMYYVYAKMFRMKAVPVAYDDHLKVDVDRVVKALSPQTKIVAFANPNSPTGTVFQQEELETIIRAASNVGATVLLDEAYYPFNSETMLDAVGKFDNLVVTRTFSKAAGLAGMRVGMSISNPSVAKALTAVKPMYEITAISVLLAEYVLDHYDRVFEYARRTNEGKAALGAYLREKGYRVFEGHANFILVDFGKNRDAIVRSLKKKDILFKESFDHPSMKQYCRFSVGPKEANEPLMSILEEVA